MLDKVRIKIYSSQAIHRVPVLFIYLHLYLMNISALSNAFPLIIFSEMTDC